MGLDSVPKLSFGLNETLRLVIPGYFLLVLITAFLGVLDSSAIISFNAEQFLAAGLALGFICYSIAYPTRRRSYQQALPSKKLLDISRKHAIESGKPFAELDSKTGEHTRLYFYFLNTFFPPTFYEVIMVTGGLYFCGTYMWLFVGAFGLLGFAALAALLALRYCGGVGAFSCFGLQLTADGGHLFRLGLLSSCELLVWYLMNPSRKLERMMITICSDQEEWFKLNFPLVRDIIEYRRDPRCLVLLERARYESDAKDGGSK